ncbi:MAG: adenylate/guanylate cyclase domain-containing protein [Cyanobacteriota bacterium]
MKLLYRYYLKTLKFIRNRKFIEILFLVISLVMIYIVLYFVAQSVEPNIYDIMIKVYTQVSARDKAKVDNRIILVTIDDESISKVGRWPWPREKYIELFDYIKNQGHASVITFDSVIKGYDNWNQDSDKIFFSSLKDFPNLRAGFGLIETPELDFNVVSSTKLEKFELKNVTDNRENKQNLGVYNTNETPPEKLLNNIAGMGCVLTDTDNDRKVRSIAYIFYYKGNYYPSLSLATVLAYYNDLNPEVIIYNDKTIIKTKNNIIEIPTYTFQKPYVKTDFKNKSFVKKIFDRLIGPFYKQSYNKIYNKTWIKWYSPQNYKTISYPAISSYKIFNAINDLKDGKKPTLNPDIFNNKIVVIGATSTAIRSGVEDIKSTPLYPNHPGVDIQATTINNLLDSDFIKKAPPITNLYILIGVIAIVLFLIFLLQELYLTVISIFCIALTFLFTVMFWFYPSNLAVDVATPLLYLCVTPMIIYSIRFFIEKRKRDELSTVLGKVVSSDVMAELLKDPNIAELEGKRAEITILFSDIRGFTTLSEKLSPDEVSKKLNTYFNKMEPIIHDYKGTLDKFMGDGIMAIFGAPVQHSDHAMLAIKAALEMQNKLEDLNKDWEKSGGLKFEMGIGINTGYCFVGNLGSKKRIQYTAIGDAVNIASRLEQLNKQFNTKIIISQFTYEKVRQLAEVRALKKESIRGRTEQVMIYELRGIRDPKDIIATADPSLKKPK